MNIEKNISDLLYRYQCVTVPGFGAFLTELKSAQIDSNNVMQPPKKVLSFNPHLVNNDGLLANHIATEEKISYSEAIVYLKNEVNEWKLKLEQNDRIVLHNIGEITLNSERNLVFSPSDNVNYDSNSFGLTNIVTPEIPREEEIKEEVEIPVIAAEPKPDFSDIFTNVPPKESTFITEEPIVQQPKAKNKATGIFKAAAVVAVLTGAGLYGFKIYNDNKVENETLMVQQNVKDQLDQKIEEATFVMNDAVPAVDVNVKEEPITTPTNTETTTEVPAAEPVVTETTKTVKPKAEEKVNNNTQNQVSNSVKMPYHIIAGSFKSKDNANNKVKDLINKGYKNATIVEKNSNELYVVAYGSYADLNKAKSDLKTIQQSDNDQAWVLTK